MNRAQLDMVIEVVEEVIGPAGFECVEAEWFGNEKVLRLYVDQAREDGAEGIDLEGCAKVSRLLEECVRLDDLIPGSYQLEVSSPGVERPLRRLTHFQKVLGETVQVKLQAKILDRKNGTGRLVDVRDNEVILETTQGPWSFPIDQVQRASLVFNWNNH